MRWTRSVRALGWACTAWCLVFAAPHVYWAVGGRAGLGAEAAAADAALATWWFAAYNVVATVLALVGAWLAPALAQGWPGPLRRWWHPVVTAAAVLLLVRGAIGLVGLALAAAGEGIDSPVVLLAVEPWFVLGGLLFGALALASRRPGRPIGGDRVRGRLAQVSRRVAVVRTGRGSRTSGAAVEAAVSVMRRPGTLSHWCCWGSTTAG